MSVIFYKEYATVVHSLLYNCGKMLLQLIQRDALYRNLPSFAFGSEI